MGSGPGLAGPEHWGFWTSVGAAGGESLEKPEICSQESQRPAFPNEAGGIRGMSSPHPKWGRVPGLKQHFISWTFYKEM